MTGKYTHGLDAKGRLIIPAQMRRELGDVCYVVRGSDKCLLVYSEEGWEKCQKLLAVLREIGSERNASVAEVSINWVLGHPGVTCSLMGATTPQMAEENAAAAEWELTPEEYDRIEAAYQKFIIG